MAKDAPPAANRPGSTAPQQKPKLVPLPGDAAPSANQSADPATPTVQDEKSKVVHIIRRLQDEVTHGRSLKKKPWLQISVLACIALPTLIAGLYYFVIAADRYASEARFSVRSNEPQAADALGLMTGITSTETVSDSYIVVDYIKSLEMITRLEERLPLQEMYRVDGADFFSRLGSAASQEEFVDYWQDRIGVYFDSTKQTIALEVQAFVPEHAQRIATEALDIVGNLVNELSAKSRRDAVQFAASELARTELRVRAAREDLREFRVANNELDPSMTAETTQTITTQLEGERARLASQLASLTGYLADNAPSVQMLKSRISALDGELTRIKRQVSQPSAGANGAAGSAGSSEALASTISKYQELLLEQEFAEKAYTAALASLDRARAEAARTQTYLAIFAEPKVAQDAAYPYRWTNVFVVFVISCVLWAIGALGFLTVRDHMT